MSDNEASELTSVWDEARSRIERGDYDKAIEIYKYILIRYADVPVYVEYANAYMRDVFLTLRQLKPAEHHLKKAIVANPGNAHYHYLLGFTYSIAAQWTKAVKAFRKAIRLEPNNAVYQRDLGWAVFNGGDKIEGLSHLSRALELAPHDVQVVTDLGAAMLIMGNFKKARDYAKQAAHMDPNSETIRRLLHTVKSFEKMTKPHTAM